MKQAKKCSRCKRNLNERGRPNKTGICSSCQHILMAEKLKKK